MRISAQMLPSSSSSSSTTFAKQSRVTLGSYNPVVFRLCTVEHLLLSKGLASAPWCFRKFVSILYDFLHYLFPKSAPWAKKSETPCYSIQALQASVGYSSLADLFWGGKLLGVPKPRAKQINAARTMKPVEGLEISVVLRVVLLLVLKRVDGSRSVRIFGAVSEWRFLV